MYDATSFTFPPVTLCPWLGNLLHPTIPLIVRKAKQEGVPLSVETCYHYLYFESETIPKAQPKFKCCPPIREAENRNKLWEALQEGLIDLVVSDHSPCTPDLKGRVSNDTYSFFSSKWRWLYGFLGRNFFSSVWNISSLHWVQTKKHWIIGFQLF